ncbi:MAG: hypothetical protein JKY13_01625, partial [Gammaproteobacteria bacterium]|nr:hypothetical protein [Gammaproteobacteria bacterium]
MILNDNTMPSVRHIIKRQTLELQMASKKEAFFVQERMKRLYYNELLPIIHACCNQLSPDNTIYRIDKLEIDLGDIKKNNLDRTFVNKLSAMINKSVSMAMTKAEVVPVDDDTTVVNDVGHSSQRRSSATNSDATVPDKKPVGSKSDRLKHFTKTGTLPWWSEEEDAESIEEQFIQLSVEAPADVKHLIRQSLSVSRQLKRLIYQLSDKTLVKLAKLFVPRLGFFIRDLYQDWRSLVQDNNIEGIDAYQFSRSDQRFYHWEGLFHSVCEPLEVDVAEEQLTTRFLLHIAAVYKVNYQPLVLGLRKAIMQSKKNGHVFRGEFDTIVEQLIKNFKQDAAAAHHEQATTDLAGLLNELRHVDCFSSKRQALCQAILAKLNVKTLTYLSDELKQKLADSMHKTIAMCNEEDWQVMQSFLTGMEAEVRNLLIKDDSKINSDTIRTSIPFNESNE